ncbi:MAG: IS110 family transposase [Candidatus Zixiibacteriota bacterium]
MTAYIGMDLSRKMFSAFVCTSPTNGIHKKSYPMAPFGIMMLVADVRKIMGKDNDLRFCFEASTECHWVDNYLCSLGYKTHPFHTTHFRQIASSSRKSDKIDAKKMAQAFAAGMLPRRVELPKGRTEEARRLLNERAQWVSLLSGAAVRLKALARKFGVNYEGVGSLTNPNNWKEFCRLMKKTCSRDVARHLDVMESYLKAIADCERQYQEMMTKKEKELVKNWRTVPGVGAIVAWVMLAYIGDGSRFENGRRAASYFGLTPREYQSGERHIRGGLTKEGPTNARAMLIEAARMLAKSNEFKKSKKYLWFKALEARRGRKKAITALARWLVTVAVEMAKQGRKFEPTAILEPAA